MGLEQHYVGDGHLTALRGIVMSWGGLLLLGGVAAPFIGFWMGVTEHELRDLGPLVSMAMLGLPGLLVLGVAGGTFLWSGFRIADGRSMAWFGCFAALVTLVIGFWPLAIYGFFALCRAEVRRFCGLS